MPHEVWYTKAVMFAQLFAACSSEDGPGTHSAQDSVVDSAAPDSDTHGGDSAPDEPVAGTYVVDIGRQELFADGRDSTLITVSVPDGTLVPQLSVDLGALTGPEDVSPGVLRWSYRAGTWPGTATLAVTAGALAGETSLTVVDPPGHSSQLHLHGSLSEGNGLMTNHIGSAETMGLDVMWWTDHDTFYYNGNFLELQSIDFEEGGLTRQIPGFPTGTAIDVTWVEEENTLLDGSATVTTEAANGGSYGLRLSGTAAKTEEWSRLRLTVAVRPKVNLKTMLAGVTLGFDLRASLGDDADFILTVPMSETPVVPYPEASERAVRFYLSEEDLSAESTRGVLWAPLRGGPSWSTTSIDLTSLANRHWPSLEGDLHGEFVTVELRARNGATATVDLDNLLWTQISHGDELRTRQEEWLAAKSSGAAQFVGLELSELSEGHFNAFGSGVPFLPYAEEPAFDAYAAAELVHDAGGLISYNHMFGAGNDDFDEETRATLIAARIDSILESRAWGADLLEVGYRRRQGLLDDFFQVWDAVGIAGLTITGIGVSDLHDDVALDAAENNFVSWLGAADTSEEELLAALDRGNVWFGDPTAFGGCDVTASLTVPTLRAGMGQVVVGAEGPVAVVFRADPLESGSVAHVVEDGTVTASYPVEADGAFAFSHVIDPTGGRLVRVQVHNSRDEGILYTNPILFTDTADGVPPERLPRP
jgi:hypothetical protein